MRPSTRSSVNQGRSGIVALHRLGESRKYQKLLTIGMTLLVCCGILLVVTSAAGAAATPYSVKVDSELGTVDVTTPYGCKVIPREPLKVTITTTVAGKSATTSYRYPDACRPAAKGAHTYTTRLWSLRSFLGSSGLDFELDSGFVGEGYVKFTFQSGGDTQAARLHFLSTDTSQVWNGSDGFVNYCINALQKIESEGGQLFCWKYGKVYWRRA